MVVGFDVCHDTRNKNNSYAALVASLDKPFSRYFSTVEAHPSGEELSSYFNASMTSEFVCSPCNLLTFITLTFADWVLQHASLSFSVHNL
jgi:hypothetical protein